MAEQVEQRLEQLVPAFEQLQQLKIFNSSECKAIIEKTREHENQLTSRTVRKEKYLDYVKYFASVMELTNERKEKAGIDSTKQKLLADIDWPKHIHSIFRRLVGRFPDDLDCWNLYFEFCQQREDLKSLSYAFDQCLKTNKNKPEVWIRAAQWEMTSNNNPELARKYMLTAVEINKNSPECYATLAETVLYLTNQIQQRREVQEIEQDSDVTKAPLVIYEKALDECPEQLKKVFNLFYDLFIKYNMPIDELIKKTEERDNYKLYAAIALKADNPDEIFQKYINEHPSIDLKIKYAKYIGKDSTRGDDLVKLLDDIDEFSDEEATKFCELLLKCGKYKDAKEMLEDGEVNDTMRKCRLQIMSYDIQDNKDFIEHASSYVEKQPNQKELTGLMLFLLAKRKPDFESEWEPLLIKEANHVDTDELAKIMSFTLVHFGAQKADQLLSKLLKIVVPTPSFIEQATRIVTQNGGTDDKVRYLHETAVQKFGKVDPNVWINFCAFEAKNKNYKKVEAIRYRAMHTLDDTSEFQRLYHDKFCRANESN